MFKITIGNGATGWPARCAIDALIAMAAALEAR